MHINLKSLQRYYIILYLFHVLNVMIFLKNMSISELINRNSKK